MNDSPLPQLPHPQDVLLGAHIRLVREASGLTLEHIATELHISLQQVQKYETGQSRISYSRLTEIAEALNVGVIRLLTPICQPDFRDRWRLMNYVEFLSGPLMMDMLQAFSKISSPTVRQAVLKIAQSLESAPH